MSEAHDRDRAAEVLERLLVDPLFRAEFRRDPAGHLDRAGLDGLAREIAESPAPMQALESRESKSSLAGVMLAVAAEVVGVIELTHAMHGGGMDHDAGRAAGLALSRPHIKALTQSMVVPREISPAHAGASGPVGASAHVAHELRTPLAVIRAELDAARSDPQCHPRELSLVDAIDRANDRGERLVSALLDLACAELGTSRPAPFDLTTLVGDLVVDDARRFTAARLRLELDLGDDGDPAALVLGDRSLTAVLIRNLIDNAATHARANTTVRVSLEVTGEAPSRAVTLRVRNVCDPLDPSVFSLLGEPFRRGPGRLGADGHGLGLAIVRAAGAASNATVVISQPAEDAFQVDVVFAAA